MTTSTRPLESPPASPDSALLPASSLTPEPAEIRAGETVEPSYAGDPCDYCGGEGTDANAKPCPICEGTGRHPSWQDLYHRARALAARIESRLNAQVSSLEQSVRYERDAAAAKARDYAAYMDSARATMDRGREMIDKLERDLERARKRAESAVREVEDLQRQLRLASRRIVDLKTERAA